MNKKVSLVIWTIVLIIAILCAGVFIYNTVQSRIKANVHPILSLEIQDYGTVEIELFPEYAPNTVSNIISLAENGFYDGKTIWGKDELSLYFGRNTEGEEVAPRLSNIQKDVTDEQDYEYSIEGEFLANKFKPNTMKAEKGTVLLLRDDYTQLDPSLSDESYNSGKAQFAVIMGDNAAQITGMYATFGKIKEGQDVIEKIYTERPVKEAEATDASDSAGGSSADASGIEQFANYVTITKASVEKYGIDFGLPKIQEAFDYQSYMYDLINQYYGGGTVTQ